MKNKNIRQRVYDSFRYSPHGDILQFMEWLRSTMEELTRSLRRTIATILLLIAAFELVYQSPKTELAIGSFKISSGSVVVIFIPAVTSYLFLQMMDDSIRLWRTQKVFSEVFTIWSSEAEKNDLDLWVLPPQAAYWNQSETKLSEFGWKDRITAHIRTLISASIFVAVIVFEIQAYYVLHAQHIANNIPWTISVVMAAVFSIVALTEFIILAEPNLNRLESLEKSVIIRLT
jgi:hypothetical protein